MLRIPKQFVSFIFENNSIESVLSKLTSVLEWNAAYLAITSPLFRSTFSIIHERINLTLVCRVLIIRLVIACLELSRNDSGSYPFNSFIWYGIAKSSKQVWTMLDGTKYLYFHTFFLIFFLKDLSTLSTTFGFGGM